VLNKNVFKWLLKVVVDFGIVCVGERNYNWFPNNLLTTNSRDGVIIRVMVTGEGTNERPCRVDMTQYNMTAVEPPPSYDVAVIYSGYRLNPLSSNFSPCHSQV